MIFTELFETKDVCPVCGQTPCNCTSVKESADVDTSVVVGKLYDIIDHTEDMIKNADYDQQVQYATTVRDRATKAINMIKSGTDASTAFKYFQTGQQGVTEAPGAETLAHNQSTVASNEKAFDLEEGKPEKPERPEADYGDDYQAMVARVKKLAGLGPLKTVYDPAKRVYKNVPVAVQPGNKK